MRRIVIILIIHAISCYCFSQNSEDLRYFINDNAEKYIDSLIKRRNLGDNSNIMFVINIAELDTTEALCSFCIGYIMNNIEISWVEATHYKRIGNRKIMVKSYSLEKELSEILHFPRITSAILEEFYLILREQYFPYEALIYLNGFMKTKKQLMNCMMTFW